MLHLPADGFTLLLKGSRSISVGEKVVYRRCRLYTCLFSRSFLFVESINEHFFARVSLSVSVVTQAMKMCAGLRKQTNKNIKYMFRTQMRNK